MGHAQDEVQAHSLADPESFWGHQASRLHWHRQPSAALRRTTKKLKSGVSHAHWEWFPDGEISTCYNCVDRHVAAGHGDAPAIFYDSPVTGTKQRITYAQLLDEVEVLAAVLRDEGVKKGDVVLVYSEEDQHDDVSPLSWWCAEANHPWCGFPSAHDPRRSHRQYVLIIP